MYHICTTIRNIEADVKEISELRIISSPCKTFEAIKVAST
jgi:hypothetical protein